MAAGGAAGDADDLVVAGVVPAEGGPVDCVAAGVGAGVALVPSSELALVAVGEESPVLVGERAGGVAEFCGVRRTGGAAG